MDVFEGIARVWFSSVITKQLDINVQVVETSDSDQIAPRIYELALEQGVKTFSFECRAERIADPFKIVHSILRDFGEVYGHDIVEQKIAELCYALHRPILTAWYRQEEYFRTEPILIGEVGYEEIELFDSIEAILSHFSAQTPFVILVKNIHYASEQFLTIVNRLFKSVKRDNRWGVLGFVPNSKNMRAVQSSDAWQESLRLLERYGLIIPIHFKEKKSIDFQWNIIESILYREQTYQMLITAIDMFAYADCLRMVDVAFSTEGPDIDSRMYFIRAAAGLFTGDLDSAVRDFNMVQNHLQHTSDIGLITASYFWLSICHTEKSQERYARAAQEQCEKLALDYDDGRWYALSLYAAFYIDIHLNQYKLTAAALESLRFLLGDLNYTNILAQLQTKVYIYTQHFDPISSRTYLRNCVRALRTSRKSKNQLGISNALYSMGVVYSQMGNLKLTQRLFETSLKLRESYQRKAEIVPLLNGLGNFFIGREEWHRAWSYFDRSFSLLMHYRNFNEISMTLYHFIWLYIQCNHVQRALDITVDLIELMNIRGVQSVPFRNLKDLYVLKAWMHTTLNQPIQAHYCLLRVQRLPELSESEFSNILLKIVDASLNLSEGNSDTALSILVSAQEMVLSSLETDLNHKTKLVFEISTLLRRLNLEKQVKTVLMAFLNQLKGDSNPNLEARIKRFLNGFEEPLDLSISGIRQHYSVLLELARKESQMADIRNELSDMHQANLLFQMSADEPDVEVFLENLIAVLDKRIPADSLAVFISTDGYTKNSTFNNSLIASNDVPIDRIQRWQAKLIYSPLNIVRFRDRDFTVAAWPLFMETSDNAWLIVAGDDQQSEVWNEDFFNLVAQQLGLVLDRRFRVAYLEHRNKTDILTGVLNRAGLYERLKKQFSQMQRDPEMDFSLCYFDLDHFKYFNDQFGHELGDKVLKKLVACVESELRGSDELARLGGDEFIILLKDTNESDAAVLLERLREKISKPDWWLPLIISSADCNQINPVPEQEWISASFGVIVVNGWPDNGVDRIDIIAQADTAMYEAKSNGRNCVVIKPYQKRWPQTERLPSF